MVCTHDRNACSSLINSIVYITNILTHKFNMGIHLSRGVGGGVNFLILRSYDDQNLDTQFQFMYLPLYLVLQFIFLPRYLVLVHIYLNTQCQFIFLPSSISCIYLDTQFQFMYLPRYLVLVHVPTQIPSSSSCSYQDTQFQFMFLPRYLVLVHVPTQIPSYSS